MGGSRCICRSSPPQCPPLSSFAARLTRPGKALGRGRMRISMVAGPTHRVAPSSFCLLFFSCSRLQPLVSFSCLSVSSSLRRWLWTDTLRPPTATSLCCVHVNVRPIGGAAPASHSRRHINSRRPPRLARCCSRSRGCRPHRLRRLLTVTQLLNYHWSALCRGLCG